MMWAQDLERVARWYKDKLGFQIVYHAPKEFLSLYHTDMGRIDFHGAASSETTSLASEIRHGPLPYFSVSDITKTKEWLEGKGIRVNEIQQVSDSPKHTWFWDSEGNVLGLQEN